MSNPFDIAASNKNLSAYERNRLYLNLGGEDFLDVSFTSGVDLDSDSRSVIDADFDRDGAPDLLVASSGGGALRLFRNRCPQQNRIWLELTGLDSNRSAIGTRVIAQCGERKIVRDLFSHNGFMGQGPAELSLGIGTATQIDRLTIRWPTGKEQVFENVALTDRLRLQEGSSNLESRSR